MKRKNEISDNDIVYRTVINGKNLKLIDCVSEEDDLILLHSKGDGVLSRHAKMRELTNGVDIIGKIVKGTNMIKGPDLEYPPFNTSEEKKYEPRKYKLFDTLSTWTKYVFEFYNIRGKKSNANGWNYVFKIDADTGKMINLSKIRKDKILELSQKNETSGKISMEAIEDLKENLKRYCEDTIQKFLDNNGIYEKYTVPANGHREDFSSSDQHDEDN